MESGVTMKISELEVILANARGQHGDIEVACMTAPFNDGETEVLNLSLITVSQDEPDNGDAKPGPILYIGGS